VTNPIGTGTRNVAVNMPTDFAGIVGQLAFGANKSVGQLFREAVIEKAERDHPERATELRLSYRQYYGTLLGLVFLIGMFHSWLSHDEIARRCRRGRCEEIEEVAEV
jgi:hypothetical protein